MGGTYSKVDRIIHLIRRSEISEKRTWSVLDRSPWDRSSLECRIVTDGCDDIIDDEEFRILPCGFSQFGEDLGAVWVAPVVKDLRTRIKGGLEKGGGVWGTNLLEDENGGVFDRLRSEKVVRLEIDSTFFHRFRDFFRP